jgi:hypothetical protein
MRVGTLWFLACACATMLGAVREGHAQSVTVTTTRGPRGGDRGGVTSTIMLGPSCASIAGGGSPLATSPEGIAVLMLRKELQELETVLRGREGMQADRRSLDAVRRDVESLVDVVVRRDSSRGFTLQRADGADARFWTLFPRGATNTVSIESTVRALEPRVAALTDVGARVVSRSDGRGYLGVTLSGQQVRLVTDSGTFTSHCEYPVVEAVELGSPAREAGVSVGDELVAYNGRDVLASAVNYPDLLQPGRVVRVRVRRDGRTRELPVRVVSRGEDVAVPMVPSLSASAAQPIAPPTAVWSSSAMLSLLGAQFNAIDAEFGASLGLEAGVLVIRVQPDSPAADAGVRVGEMVRAVNGVAVRDLTSLQRLVHASTARSARLTVSARGAPPRIVTIRW